MRRLEHQGRAARGDERGCKFGGASGGEGGAYLRPASAIEPALTEIWSLPFGSRASPNGVEPILSFTEACSNSLLAGSPGSTSNRHAPFAPRTLMIILLARRGSLCRPPLSGRACMKRSVQEYVLSGVGLGARALESAPRQSWGCRGRRGQSQQCELACAPLGACGNLSAVAAQAGLCSTMVGKSTDYSMPYQTVGIPPPPSLGGMGHSGTERSKERAQKDAIDRLLSEGAFQGLPAACADTRIATLG